MYRDLRYKVKSALLKKLLMPTFCLDPVRVFSAEDLGLIIIETSADFPFVWVNPPAEIKKRQVLNKLDVSK